MDRKKLVHTLDGPFSTVQWPSISREDQDTILELLCSLLSPLGNHRRTHITPSKGKRSLARKRKAADVQTKPGDEVPLPPRLSAYVDVGLSDISRNLEKMSQLEPPTSPGGKDDAMDVDKNGPETSPYAVVFVARTGQPPAFNSHFPQMVAVASKAHPGREPTRLVGFSQACDDRLSAALGIPRASSVAIRADAPQSKALVNFVLEHVASPEIPWLAEAQGATYLPTKIKSTETAIGAKKQKKTDSIKT